MSQHLTPSRRHALQLGLGLLALGAFPRSAAGVTPAQTEGPFFPLHAQDDTDFDMTRIAGHHQAAEGEVVVVEGTVRDEAGAPLAGVLIDIWQANRHGRYAHERDPNPAPLDPHFQGWAQLRSDAEGRYRVRTIIPGAYPVSAGWSRPPHLHFKLALRGYHELTTQMYFAGQPLNARDRLLNAVPEGERAQLVVAFAAVDGDSAPHGRFELVLRAVAVA
jgi:protocatechuate 3,4-dioxygenase, beta subunit